MAKTQLISLIKPIEAIKVHPRSGLPLGGPDVTVPYGALIEHLGSDRDREKFSYLGEHYTCTRERFLSATAAPKPEPKSATAAAAAPAVEDEETPEADEGPRLEWEQLRSKDFTVRRAAIPGGWLVAVHGGGLTFVPDARHEWNGASVE